ncbi:MAG: penicillin acylase family protein [Thermoflexales bacterium]|nr:penicillin acylase family protein [Thermoflexales bacterium]
MKSAPRFVSLLFRRILPILLAVVLLLGAVSGGAFLITSRASHPQTSGSAKVAGLTGKVEVIRDKFGVPHIYADTPEDLFRAQGYVHAQDRYFQMEFWRRIGQGRISELFGKSALNNDKFIRTIGWARVAEEEAAGLSGDMKRFLDAYSAGVNAYIMPNADKLGFEFKVLGLIGRDFKPEAWTPANSLTWGKAMAYDLGGNMDDELLRAALLDKGGKTLADALLPPYPKDMPVIVPSAAKGEVETDAIAQTPAMDGELALQLLTASTDIMSLIGLSHDRDIGSNDWVIAGSRSTTGKPILADDPHLGVQMPSIWYQVGLHCRTVSEACPFDVVGVSFAGVPGVIIGHNARIAWGVTNVGPDTQDWYLERANPANPDEFEFMGKFEKAKIIEEVINVAGDKPVTLKVRVTRHGPIMNDVVGGLQGSKQPIALKWTSLSPGSLYSAVIGIDKARNWTEFRNALRDWDSPSQNFVFADIDGNIGYQMPGRVPIRASGDGGVPVAGWTGDSEWTGFLLFDDLPSVYNPPEGYVATANNAVVDSDRYKPFISKDWDYGFRARQIVSMITAKDKVSPDDVRKMQLDDTVGLANDIVPYLDRLSVSDDALVSAAIKALQTWNRRATADQTAPLIFEHFWYRLAWNIYADETGAELAKSAINYGTATKTAVRQALADPASRFWDNVTTGGVTETRDQIILASMREAVAELKKGYGDDITKWTWGRAHTITFQNQTLGKSGTAPIEDIFNRGPFPADGASASVNNLGGAGPSYKVTSSPSLRMVVDLSDLSKSTLIHTTGQSGHAYNGHYDDMIKPYLSGATNPMYWTRAEVEKNAEGTLVLNP